MELFLLKQTPKVEDWFIPYLLTFVGIGFAFGLLGVNIEAVIQGILVSAVTVFIHQLLKQADQKIILPRTFFLIMLHIILNLVHHLSIVVYFFSAPSMGTKKAHIRR